ncbi:MAG TPA: exodeoxyribonuclease VII large subunit, partial [Bacteroidales bacterium]|nr:exodeoxyribonuclease VII large subunit [Bacteroidales bacterium]
MEEHINRYSLSQLQDLIKEAIENSLSGFYWVSAEISELKLNYSGHCYIELVEKTGNDDIKSRIRTIIWSQKARMLLPYFESSTGQELSEGLKVLLKVKTLYHRVYGLSLNVYDIDPAYTLGEMAILRKKIIGRLETEGVINLNRELSFPLLPKNIAIISSELAAGYQDFYETLLNNEYGYTYNITLYKSVMQGKETEKSVSGAINRIFESNKKYDLIVIVRGGGSQADLSWFDNYNIAFLITQMPVPVITGIGHEKDLSVTDMVAHKAFKTPTAVAEFIISQSRRTEEYLAVLQESIISKSQDMVQKGRSLINRVSADLSPLVRDSLKKKQAVLNKSALRLSGSTRSFLAYKRSVLKSS